ncbi:MAG: hypothetical protein KAS01_03000 [Candidatus Pacebacteria bacterium]|nr:hypothetical protein [Candidatus Paceibacterota bacterium]
MPKKIKIRNKTGLSNGDLEKALRLVGMNSGIPLSTLCSRCKPKKVGFEPFLKNVSEETDGGLLFVNNGKRIELSEAINKDNFNTVIVKAK